MTEGLEQTVAGTRPRFVRTFVAASADIDELGHVNNAVWVRWVQELAVAHWNAVASPAHVEAYFWVVLRHEIDFRANVGAGAQVRGETWVEGQPRGARFDRRVEFYAGERLLVQALTTWAIVDRASGRVTRVPPAVAAPFIAS